MYMQGERHPLAIITKGKGGKRVHSLNRAGLEAGLRSGMLLTDACAMLPSLITAPHDPKAECGALKRLAASCNRFSPWTAPDEPHGLWIEATGVAHLFANDRTEAAPSTGEAELLHHILEYLRGLGFTACAAMAGTPGAAWGLARFSSKPDEPVIAPSGEEASFLNPLPVKALRLGAENIALLNGLGLKTIGQLLAIPRASLRARFGKTITNRIDQALGESGEALSPLMPEPVYAARAEFADPLTVLEGLEQTARLLIEDVTAQLAGDGKGARRFTLMLFDSQGGVNELNIRMARPDCEPGHIASLLREKLRTLEGCFDPASGFDAVTLYAMNVEPLRSYQDNLLDRAADEDKSGRSLAQFLDRVEAKLGSSAATRFAFQESHWPEKAVYHTPALARSEPSAPIPLPMSRPLMLLPYSEPIKAIAAVPDYPPHQFVWRRCRHRIVRAEGPERISPEWWSSTTGSKARDYYVVEDEKGRRFWVYREGVYNTDGRQCWFIHGLFP